MPFYHLLLLLLLLSAPNQQARAQYDEAFYQEHTKLKPAYSVLSQVIANTVNSSNQIIVDVGCGHGFLVDALREQAETFTSVYCLESSPAAIPFWPVNLRSFYHLVDLESATLLSMPKENVDVIVSFEVAEHITIEHSNNFVQLLTSKNPSIIFFTAATVGQGGVDHFNENSFSYWIDKFQVFGYLLDVKETIKVRNYMLDQFENFLSCPWYPKNMLIFRRQHLLSSLESNDLALQAYNGEKWLRSNMPYGCEEEACYDLYDKRDRAEFQYLRARAIFYHLENQAKQAKQAHSNSATTSEWLIQCQLRSNRTWRVKINKQQTDGRIMRKFIVRHVKHDHKSLQVIRERVQAWMLGSSSAAHADNAEKASSLLPIFFLSAKDRNGQRMIISEHQQLENVLVMNNYENENEMCVSEITMQVLV